MKKKENAAEVKNVQLTIEDFQKTLQMAFDAGRKFAIDAASKYTCTGYGVATYEKLMELSDKKQDKQEKRKKK